MSEVVPLSPLRLPIPPYPQFMNNETSLHSTKKEKKDELFFSILSSKLRLELKKSR
jgi:hypothetical protein